MYALGRLLIALGILIAIAGFLLLAAAKIGIPGRLPGDFALRGKNSSFYFPLATCLIISALLSLVFYILGRIRH